MIKRQAVIDFIIGLTLINGLPHFILGIYRRRMLSLFGTSPQANIAYGILNLIVSLSLFIYQYGTEGFFQNEMYLGGLFVMLAYLAVGKLVYRTFQLKQPESKQEKL